MRAFEEHITGLQCCRSAQVLHCSVHARGIRLCGFMGEERFACFLFWVFFLKKKKKTCTHKVCMKFQLTVIPPQQSELHLLSTSMQTHCDLIER